MATELQHSTEIDPYNMLYVVFEPYCRYIEEELSLNGAELEKPIFEKSYIVKSLQEWNEEIGPEYEYGNKIIAPDSELHKIVLSNDIEKELILQIFNPNLPQKISHCSVIEWSAPNNIIYIPSWMIKDFCLENISNKDRKLILRYYKKPFLKGSIITIQPYKLSSIQSDEFQDIQNLFEKSLKKYQCLTIGDILRIKYNQNIHLFEIIDVLSAQSIASITPFNVVSIINTNVSVQFLPPKDVSIEEITESRIDGYDIDIDVDNIDPHSISNPSNNNDHDDDENDMEEIKENNVFNGIGNQLNDDNDNNDDDEMKLVELFNNIEAQQVVCNENENKTRIQVIFIDNRREVINVNLTTTVQQIYGHCKFVSRYDAAFKLLAGYPPIPLFHLNATVQNANLSQATIIQKAI